MNLILFSTGSRGTRQVPISTPLVGALASALVALLALAAVFGYQLAAEPVSVSGPIPELVAMHEALAGERNRVAEVRREAQERIDALTLQMGALNANVIRLHALGRRLTSMADLEPGEFDFDNAPAFGGPEEPPLVAGTAQLPGLMNDIDALDNTLYDQQQQLAALEDMLLNRKLRKRGYPAGRPVKAGYISSVYGSRADPLTGKTARHKGVDFAGKRGTEVISVAAGVVTWSGDRYGYGQMVEIRHGNGYVTRYAHNDQNLVAVGDRVRPGQTIALLGSTGRATGPHVHFEVLHRGQPVDPVKYIREST